MRHVLVLFILLLSFMSETPAFSQQVKWTYSVSSVQSNVVDGDEVAYDGSGNVYLAGDHSGEIKIEGLDKVLKNPAYVSGLLMKLSANGKPLWAHSIRSKKDCRGFGLAVDKNGNSLITGTYDGTILLCGIKDTLRLTAERSGTFFAKYNPDGEVLWAKSFEGLSYSKGIATAFDESGNVLLYGDYVHDLKSEGIYLPPKHYPHYKTGLAAQNFTHNRNDYFIAKYTGAGDLLWCKSIGGAKLTTNWWYAQIRTKNNNIYVSGTFSGSVYFTNKDSLINDGWDDGTDAFLAKYDANGDFTWARQISGKNNQYISDFKIDEKENACLTGSFAFECFVKGKVNVDYRTAYKWKLGDSFFLVKLNKDGETQWARFHSEPKYTTHFIGSTLVHDEKGNWHVFGIHSDTAYVKDAKEKIHQMNVKRRDWITGFHSIWDQDGNLQDIHNDLNASSGTWTDFYSSDSRPEGFCLLSTFHKYIEMGAHNKKKKFKEKSRSGGRGTYIINFGTEPENVKEPVNSESTEIPEYTAINSDFKTLIRQGIKKIDSLLSGSDVLPGISVFPNPTTGLVNVDFEQEKGQALIEIYSSDGLLVFSEPLLPADEVKGYKRTYDLTGLSTGMYILCVRKNNEQKFFKIILQKS
jgi:hypothetical protein